MSETGLQGNEKRVPPVVARRASVAYGDEFLTENLPSKEPYIGAGDIETISRSRSLMADDMFSRVWPEKLDPIAKAQIDNSATQSDLLESEEKEVQKLIYQVKTSLIRYREKLANRLVTLFKDSKEEDPYGSGISAGSIRSFINFLKLHLNIQCPSISLTPEYNIYASWRDERNRVFSVHFLPSGAARFVIFKPNYRHPERKIRISGLTTTDILMENVSSYNVSDWISE